LAKERDRAVAERVSEIERRRAKITRRTKELKEKLAKEREPWEKVLADFGNRMNTVVGPPPDALYALGRVAVSHIKEGAASLEEVVRRVREKFPDVEDRDVWEALNARSPETQKRAKTAVRRNITELKRQAHLLSEIDKLERGIMEVDTKTPDGRQAASARVRELQKRLRELRKSMYNTTALPAARMEVALNTLNRLQDQLDGHYRLLRQRKPEVPPDLAEVRKQADALRRQIRAEDVLADLNEQLRTGEYKIPEKRAPYMTPELERLQIEKERARRKIRAAIEAQRPWLGRRGVMEVINTLRTAKATADLSATLRQGFIATVTDPLGAAKDFGRSLRATFSRFSDERIDNSIRNSPTYEAKARAGLELTDIDGPWHGREEVFMANLLERIPLVKEVVGASERHMRTYLNLRRSNLFDRFIEATPNATEAEMKAVAHWINVMTGRGDIPRALKGATQELGAFVFAPRFAASRIQTPAMVFKYWKLPRVRKLIAKDLAKTAAFGVAVAEMAYLNGADVSLDPRDPDFGKIRFGDTRIDIWAGLQQPMRVAFRVALGVTDKAGVTGATLTEREKDVDPFELIMRFGAYKLGPAVTLPREFWRGKTIVGEERTPTESAITALTPLFLEDVRDAFRAHGIKRAALVGAATILGVGAMTYEDSEWRVRKRIRELTMAGKHKQALQLQYEYNQKHPNNKIKKVKITP